MKKVFGIVMFSLVTLCCYQLGLAQTPLTSDMSLVAKIVEARKANGAMMHQYTWNCRAELFINGELKDNRLELLSYGFGNQLTHSILNDQGASLPRGFLRRRIAEREKQEVEEYLSGLRSILNQYTLPTAGKILDFMMQAHITGPDQNGLITLSGNNVVAQGDSLSISVDPLSHHIRGMQISTFFQGNQVSVQATFKTLMGGLTYMAFAEVSVPAKSMNLQVMNFNYQRSY